MWKAEQACVTRSITVMLKKILQQKANVNLCSFLQNPKLSFSVEFQIVSVLSKSLYELIIAENNSVFSKKRELFQPVILCS